MKNHTILAVDEKTEVVEAVNPDSDVIWVNEFNEEKAKKFCEELLAASKKNKSKPIIIYIDSYGGSVDSLAAMLAVMDSVPNKLITVCTGKAMSCGAIMLSHGDLRMVAPHGRVMIHEVSSFSWGNVNDIKTDTKETDRLNKYFMELLAENCGLKSSKSLPFTNERREIYMGPKDALKFGIVDRVGVPKVERVVKYEVRVK